MKLNESEIEPIYFMVACVTFSRYEKTDVNGDANIWVVGVLKKLTCSLRRVLEPKLL